MLARLGIRQKLSLLLAIPLTAVVLVLVPFAAERVDDARAARTTARTADAARRIGALIQTLQQERLLALGYLSAESLDRSALAAQMQDAIDATARLRSDPATAAAVRTALPALGALEGIRQSIINRGVGARTSYDAYRAANTALLDALRLTNPPGADASGLSQLGALDALMRSNEEASSVGAVLVAAAADQDVSRTLLTDAVTADKQHLRRFRELVTLDQAALVDTVENGQAGQRIRQIISAMNSSDVAAPPDVSEALTAAVSYTGLRRLAQDRIAREITGAAESRARAAESTALVVAAGAVALFAVVLTLGYLVSRSISRPLRRLTRAAAVVAELSGAELVRVADSDSPDPAPPKLAAVDVDSQDEIGELAAALNRVQATAALLLERQVTTRRNVAVMFANIGRRTQNLAGRQLSLIEDLERNERDPELLGRLYRLDHVATRLRRSADSLLVVSGTIDQFMSGGPTHLSDVIRSALGEIEGFQAVDVGEVADVAISAGLVADLRLLLAELLENATNFSPPGVPVTVSAAMDGDCLIQIVDHGLGMGPVRLEEENLRLVERERLDVAPTTMLGLFVVGRLARRHGLTVRLDHSPGRGVTASVRVPARLLTTGGGLVPAQHTRAPLTARVVEIVDNGDDEPTEPFDWFGLGELVAISAAPAPEPIRSEATAMTESVASTATSDRSATVAQVDSALEPLPRRVVFVDPEPTLDDVPAPSRGGLTRRVPGTHMVAGFREPESDDATVRITRDPEAERDALNDYLAGLARGGEGDAAQSPAHLAPQTAAERHT
jgi:signal transduction histidine kinase